MKSRPLSPEERGSVNEFFMSHFKDKPIIRYVVQHTFDNKEWIDVCSYEENYFELAKKAKDEHWEYSRHMEKNLKEHPEQVWPMIGMQGVRIVKRIITEQVIR